MRKLIIATAMLSLFAVGCQSAEVKEGSELSVDIGDNDVKTTGESAIQAGDVKVDSEGRYLPQGIKDIEFEEDVDYVSTGRGAYSLGEKSNISNTIQISDDKESFTDERALEITKSIIYANVSNDLTVEWEPISSFDDNVETKEVETYRISIGFEEDEGEFSYAESSIDVIWRAQGEREDAVSKDDFVFVIERK